MFRLSSCASEIAFEPQGLCRAPQKRVRNHRVLMVPAVGMGGGGVAATRLIQCSHAWGHACVYRGACVCTGVCTHRQTRLRKTVLKNQLLTFQKPIQEDWRGSLFSRPTHRGPR